MITTSEIYALRKDGQLSEAYQMAKKHLEEDTSDVERRTALGWVLYSLVKDAFERDDIQQARRWFGEAESLQIPSEKDVFHKNIDLLRQRMLPGYYERVDAQKASKEGRRKEALDLWRKYVTKYPEDPQGQSGLGWELYHWMKELRVDQHGVVEEARRLLGQYFRLTVDKPGMLHSFILHQAVRLLKEKRLLDFLRWWNLDNLRKEDFQIRPLRNEGNSNGTVLDKPRGQATPLAAKVAMVLANVCITINFREEWPLEQVRSIQAKLPHDIWLCFRYGKLLIHYGYREEAREYAYRVLRQKHREGWAWRVLGQTYTEDSVSAMACYRKAIDLSHDVQYLGDTRLHMAELLAVAGRYAEAKREVLSYKHDQEQSDRHRQSEMLTQLCQQEWFNSVEAVSEDTDWDAELLRRADVLLLDQLPWLLGVVTGYQPASKEKKERSFLTIQNGTRTTEAPSYAEMFPDKRIPRLGTPVHLKLEDEGAYPIILCIEYREADPWDIIPVRIGIITNVVYKDQGSYATIAPGVDVRISHERFPAVKCISEGEAVAVRVRKHDEKPLAMYEVLTADITSDAPPVDIFRAFIGKFAPPVYYDDDEYMEYAGGDEHTIDELENKCCKTFGFVSKVIDGQDVFVPKPLVVAAGLYAGDQIEGFAVCTRNKKRNRLGWKAVTIKKLK